MPEFKENKLTKTGSSVVANLLSGKELQGGYNDKYKAEINCRVFSKLLDERKNGRLTNVVTYIRDSDLNSGKYPNYWMTFVKRMGGKNPNEYARIFLTGNEVCSPYFLDFFGLKTVFNTNIESDNDSKVYSVNFLKDDEELLLLSKLECGHVDFWTKDLVEEAIDCFKKSFDKMAQKYKPENNKEYFVNQFVLNILVRYYLLGDFDFSSNNFGFVVNKKKGSFRVSPNFDLEHSMNQNNSLDFNDKIIYIIENYPEVFEMFKKRLNELTEFDEDKFLFVFQKIIRETITDKRVIESYDKVLCKNIKRINDAMVSFEKTNRNDKTEEDKEIEK